MRNISFQQAGITLVELMISMLLGLGVVSGVIEIYLSLTEQSALQVAINEIQNNAEDSIQLIKKYVSKSAYHGCGYGRFQSQDFIPLQGTDKQLDIFYLDALSAVLQADMLNTNSIYINKDVGFSAGDKGVVTDCKNREIFTVKSVVATANNQTVFLEHPLQTQYSKNSEIYKIKRVIISSKATGRLSSNHQPIYALYIGDSLHRREVVQGVNINKLIYDVIDNGVLLSKPANQVSNWWAVQGVNVELSVSATHFPLEKKWYLTALLGESQ